MTDTAERSATTETPAKQPAAHGGQQTLSIKEAASALRVLRYGAVDDSTIGFDLPPAVRATVSPVIAALRWSAVLYGMIFAAQDAADRLVEAGVTDFRSNFRLGDDPAQADQLVSLVETFRSVTR